METDGQDHFHGSPDDDLDGGSGRPGSASVHKRTYQACVSDRRDPIAMHDADVAMAEPGAATLPSMTPATHD